MSVNKQDKHPPHTHTHSHTPHPSLPTPSKKKTLINSLSYVKNIDTGFDVLSPELHSRVFGSPRFHHPSSLFFFIYLYFFLFYRHETLKKGRLWVEILPSARLRLLLLLLLLLPYFSLHGPPQQRSVNSGDK